MREGNSEHRMVVRFCVCIVRRGHSVPAAADSGRGDEWRARTVSEQRLEIVERLRQLEAFLCTGRKTKRECCNALGYAYERAFSRDLTDLETLGSGVIRVVDPGKRSQYYCPRAKAIFRHT